jgi:predicted nucleic acid-binding protein
VIVVDASAVLEVLLRTPLARAAEHRLLDPRQTLHAPHLIDLEIAQVLRRYCAAGDLTDERAREALADFVDLPVTRYPHQPFLDRIWYLRHNLTAYDAAYIALAEVLHARLVTCDRALASAPGHRATIEVIA